MDRKKELKEQYKEMKPEMGIIAFTCKETGKVYFTGGLNTKTRINSLLARFQSDMYKGSRNRNIQKDWNRYGAEGFDIRVVDVLDYAKDDADIDYAEELELLLEEWLDQDPEAERIL